MYERRYQPAQKAFEQYKANRALTSDKPDFEEYLENERVAAFYQGYLAAERDMNTFAQAVILKKENEKNEDRNT